MSVFANRVSGTSTSTGAGAFVLTPLAGYAPFSAEFVIGDAVWYAAEGVNASTGALTGEWEYGIGTYSAANTLTRTTPFKSSAGVGVAINFSAGPKRITSTILAPDVNTLPAWRTAFGIDQMAEDSTLALLVSAAAFARAETQQLTAI